MDRRWQDICTWLLAAGLLISQAIPGVPEKPYIVAGAFGLLGLPTIRKVQEGINQRIEENGHDKKGAKK